VPASETPKQGGKFGKGFAMNDAIIGSTGFVGGHLLRQHAFEGRFNSRTIQHAVGQAYGTVVCAAAPGSMFEANRFPEQDKARIEALIGYLSTIHARKLVLISSIAVLADCAGGEDEGTSSYVTNLAYGRNRRALEVFCTERFESCLVVRLPALFGEGLKKNFLFDILNPMPSMVSEAAWAELSKRLPAELRAGLSAFYAWSDSLKLFVIDREALTATGRRAAYDTAVTELGMSAVGFTNPNTRFQYYDMNRLWADIELCLDRAIDVIHLAPEPLMAGEIFAALTGRPMPESAARLHREDMRTRHAAVFGREGNYIAGSTETMDLLKQFFAEESARA
jgi:hypothetical protein